MSKYQDNLNNMMSLDVFLMGLHPEEREKYHDQIIANQENDYVLLSYDVSANMFASLKKQIADSIILDKLARKFDWQTDLKKILSNPFEALVLTDIQRKIIWVNKGFEAMTGYSSHESVGKKPDFLQGKRTEKNTRNYFREKLAKEKPFDISITNYRKNGEQYLCKVQIFPLHDARHQTSHFLALEQEVYAA